MSLKYVHAIVKVSEAHVQPVTVPVWELPILEAIHAGAVETRDTLLVDRPVPDNCDEFTRLAQRYGNVTADDGSLTTLPYVASVYGQFGVGTDRLAKAIADATIVETPVELTEIIVSDDGVLKDLLGDGAAQVSSVGG